MCCDPRVAGEGNDRRPAITAERIGSHPPFRTVAIEARFRRGNTASVDAPSRSRPTITGICSTDNPRFAALPPRFRDFLGRPERLPLKDTKTKVSSLSTIPFGVSLACRRTARQGTDAASETP